MDSDRAQVDCAPNLNFMRLLGGDPFVPVRCPLLEQMRGSEILVEDERLLAAFKGDGWRVLGMIHRVVGDGDEERAGGVVVL